MERRLLLRGGRRRRYFRKLRQRAEEGFTIGRNSNYRKELSEDTRGRWLETIRKKTVRVCRKGYSDGLESHLVGVAMLMVTSSYGNKKDLQ